MVDLLDAKHWPFALDLLPEGAYLVGGIVRDALLQRPATTYLDLDFVVPKAALETAAAMARTYGAGLVVLDRDRHIARVVFAEATVDFAQMVGDDLNTDLHQRDFCMNAIAYDPRQQTFIDPLGGQRDIHQKIIRMVAPANLRADPVRLLRAYRQGSQLGFTLEPETRTTLQTLGQYLGEVAPERIRAELSYILSQAHSGAYVTLAHEDGLLPVWLPSVIDQSIQTYQALERAIAQKIFPALISPLNQPILTDPAPGEPQRRTLALLSKLACLVNPDPTIAGQELSHLTYSRQEIKVVQRLWQLRHTWMPRLEAGSLDRSEQFYLFKQSNHLFPGLVFLLVAQGMPPSFLGDLVEPWLIPDHPIAHPPVLLQGADLLRHFSLKPGPALGRLLAQVEQAQATGELSTPQEALEFVQTQLSQG
ncbi:CCA tRNA nucleotidyltransferase [Candidatus Synechococcus calcipolaris G9]|uniref:CCA tRNA nucleotidyltransferase n=1 Tax=Candidatus Synechococcus calcipolaris G9 TaxID=1497997 RepID=A0ABT6EWY4_9SYNE|nr:CCA tRNA nucleotidyltransferase [Candidatus Synechococcus calcipolaris]MDG2989420.1 CCA tRNA nucleotidyltransferase [Candidatus Synechococcus calcipolaris G9]